jgi:lipoprotein-releasing system permease protein
MVRLGEDLNEATVFVPFTTAENLFVRDSEMSSLELRVKGSVPTVQNEIQRIVGKNFEVLDRRQQHRTMYKMFNTEKWVSFALLAFILLLISFNLFGALRMMWIDKANDTLILDALGMSVSRIQNIFRLEGILVVLTGTVIGLALGISLVYLQLKTGLVTTQSTMAMAYPVKLQWSDLWLVTGLNLAVGLLVSFSLPFKRTTEAI